MVFVQLEDGPPEALAKIENYRKWKTRFLKVLDKEELLRELDSQLKDERAHVFALMLYLTAGRRNEVLYIRREDIERRTFHHHNGKDYEVLLVLLPNEKNKTHSTKLIPLVLGIDSAEDEMIKICMEYIEKTKKGFIFPKTDPSMYNQLLEPCKLTTTYRENRWPINWMLTIKFRLFPHYLRHCRLTYFAPLGPMMLIQIAGWSSSQIGGRSGIGELLDTYVRREWEQIATERVNKRI